MEDTTHYAPLLSDSDDGNPVVSPRRFEKRTSIFYLAIIASQTLLFLGFVAFNWSTYTKSNSAACSQVVYSPLQHLLEYKPVLYSNGLRDQMSVYQGEPSREVDQAWEDLYNDFGISAIPKEQAELLDNKTIALPNGKHLVEISVFHSLHCLNTMRKALRADYYTDPATGIIVGFDSEEKLQEHISHCIDDLRRSLQCGSDVSAIVWHNVPGKKSPQPSMDIVHSCRNFDKIADWAKKHRVVEF
ncbi:hypothetical protein QCA50_009028 [Cerrena zonata]|uniref:Uncharacterized protein n=1 Tax=Cerrena zonata TaxID=2478898 RepID=A0AAW0G884_9APHY